MHDILTNMHRQTNIHTYSHSYTLLAYIHTYIVSECVHKILYLIMSIFSVVSVHLSMYVIHFCYRRSGAVGSKGQISHGTFQSSESDALRFVLGNDGKTLHLPYMVLTKSHKRRGAE